MMSIDMASAHSPPPGEPVFKNLSFRTKLGLVIAPPLAVLLVFAFVVIKPRLDAAGQASDSRKTAELALASMQTIDELFAERGLSSWVLAGNADAAAQLAEARGLVDSRVTDLKAALSNASSTKAVAALGAVEQLPSLRQQVDAGAFGADAAFQNYTTQLDALFDLAGELGTDTTDVELARSGTATFNFLLVKDQFSLMRDQYIGRFETAQFSPGDVQGLIRLEATRSLYLTDFERNGDPAMRARFTIIAQSAQASIAQDIVAEAIAAGSNNARAEFTPTEWWDALTGVIAAYDTVDDGNFELFLDSASKLASDERAAAIQYSVLAIVAVLAASAAAVLLSGSLVRRLRDISGQAQTISTDRLPEVLEALRNPTREALAEALPQVSSDATDEIGSLADSFNAVLRTSVETGLDHAQRRAHTVTNMLVSLGRRNQSLIDRQLQVMDRLEARYDDPELLEGLFEVDHMVTRMRRNAENLLVLAGQQQSRSWTEPVPMADVLTGAASESPDMARVDIQVDPADNLELSGAFAVDVSHVVAELLENALSYSSPATQVVLRTERANQGRFKVWVIDQGVGMSEEDLTESNERLASPLDIDNLVTDRVGFQVIGRMAQKLGLEVTLQGNPSGGIAAAITLPNDLFEHARKDDDASAKPSGKRNAKAAQVEEADSVFRRVDTRREGKDSTDSTPLLDDDELSSLHEAEPTDAEKAKAAEQAEEAEETEPSRPRSSTVWSNASPAPRTPATTRPQPPMPGCSAVCPTPTPLRRNRKKTAPPTTASRPSACCKAPWTKAATRPSSTTTDSPTNWTTKAALEKRRTRDERSESRSHEPQLVGRQLRRTGAGRCGRGGRVLRRTVDGHVPRHRPSRRRPARRSGLGPDQPHGRRGTLFRWRRSRSGHRGTASRLHVVHGGERRIVARAAGHQGLGHRAGRLRDVDVGQAHGGRADPRTGQRAPGHAATHVNAVAPRPSRRGTSR